MTESPLIFPEFDKFLSREAKEEKLHQRAKAIWFTGLSGSGKSTLSHMLEKSLFMDGYFVQVLDGDNIRNGINNNLGFSEADRMENIRRIAEVTRLFIDAGVICLNSFISPTENVRNIYREILGRENVIEVYMSASLEVCEGRDVKGLYAKARQGIIKNFTGISDPFEAPVDPLISVDTGRFNPQECLDMVREAVEPYIRWEGNSNT